MAVDSTPSAESLIEAAIEAVARQDVPRIIASLHAAAAVAPASSATAIRMVELDLQAGDARYARRWLQRAAALEPESPALPIVVSQLLRTEARVTAEQDREQATRSLAAALVLTPDDADAQLEFAAALDPPRAAVFLGRALAVRQWAGPLINLGNIDKDASRITLAFRRYRMAIALEPAHAFAWNNLATAQRDAAEVPAALIGYARALAVAPQAAATESNLLQCLQFDEAIDDLALSRRHRAWGRRHAPLAPVQPFPNRRDPDRRLSIGYVSADLGRHPVGYFLLPALEAHDRSQVKVVCYATRDRGDDLTASLRAASDLWVDASRLGDADLVRRVRNDEIDILVDLSGHTAHNRLLVFGARPAPVQATWLGYFDTCGLDQIGYLLTDSWEVPPEQRGRFIEEVVALPAGRFAYRPPSYAPAPLSRNPGSRVTFGSFNNLAKLSDATIDVWSQILAATPDSRLLLKWSSLADSGIAASMQRRFASRGIGARRLILRGASPHAAMLAEYGEVDIALDPFPFSGCLTTVEALWMGVPVVTLVGRRPVSRQSAAILWRLGLADFVADDISAYIRTALALADDTERRRRLRQSLRARMEGSTLLDGRALAASLEDAYRRMWERWCSAANAS